MTELIPPTLPLVEAPVLPLSALRDLRATIDSALLSSASYSTRENGSHVGASNASSDGPSAPGDDGCRARKAGTRNPNGSHRPPEATADRVRIGRSRGGVMRA